MLITKLTTMSELEKELNQVPTDYDTEVEKRLLSMMREQPKKLISYFMSVLCNEMMKADLISLTTSQEQDAQGHRCKIKCVTTVEILHPLDNDPKPEMNQWGATEQDQLSYQEDLRAWEDRQKKK